MTARVSSGIEDLDVLLGGLIPGDNIVWVSEYEEFFARAEAAFLKEGSSRGEPCLYIAMSQSPKALSARLGPEVEILDARPRRRLADPVRLEQTVVQAAQQAPGRVVFDGLASLGERLGWQRAVAFFSRLCPRLFDLGSIAYWRVSRRALGAGVLDEIRKVTQCVFEVGGGHLRVVKAEGRGPSVQGRLLRLALADETVHLENERALGRLGEGLRRLRQERHLNQGDLARFAGVSPSAISQAEAGHRGLSLDTLLTISEGLGVGLDELLANEPQGDYVLARRDRAGPAASQTPLLDDPGAGLRAYLVHLASMEKGSPPLQHKGPEMVLVAQGLVQVDLGGATPVMRAGDAILATRAPIKGWRNLLGQPARLFWILRD